MHFNWFFSAKANFKVCIEAQKISVAIFSMSIPTIISTSVLNDNYEILVILVTFTHIFLNVSLFERIYI